MNRHEGFFLTYSQLFNLYTRDKKLPEGIHFNEVSFRPDMLEREDDPLWHYNFRKPTLQELYELQRNYAKFEEESKLEEEYLRIGQRDKDACNKVLMYIRGYNKRRNLNATKIIEFNHKFDALYKHLYYIQPEQALVFLKKLKYDDNLVREIMVNKCIELLSNYDCKLFYPHVEHTIIEKSNSSDIKLRMLREEVKQKLSETDYTQLADAPIESNSKKLYRGYRDYLRNIEKAHNEVTILKYKILNYNQWKKERK